MRLLPLFFVFCAVSSFAQTDTVYQYYDKAWKPADKANAFFVAKITHEKSGWHRQNFRAATNIMQMDAWYEDATTDTTNGSRRFYAETGVLTDSGNYTHGKLISKYVFYTNHAVKAVATFDTSEKIITQEGYDENGETITGYIFQQEASFPGGAEAWQQFLIKGLTTRQPKAYQDGKMSGTVIVAFLVDKEGVVIQVQVHQSSGYPELDEHAMNVIRKSPKWHPAIQYNQKVMYRQLQSLTYAPQ